MALKMDNTLGLGTAEVRMTSASTPRTSSARSASLEMSPSTSSTESGLATTPRTLSADLDVRTRPRGGAKSEERSLRSFITKEPVRPPAPVTATFIPALAIRIGTREDATRVTPASPRRVSARGTRARDENVAPSASVEVISACR